MLFIIESIILCVVFTVAVIPGTLKNPLWQLHNYPAAIQERVKSLPEYQGRIPTHKKSLGLQLTAAVIFIILLAAIAYFSGTRTFLSAFIYTFGLFMVVNWFDALVLDSIFFCHYEGFRIPGTEDMAKVYENPWMHIIGGLKGTLIGAVVSAAAAGIVFLI